MCVHMWLSQAMTDIWGPQVEVKAERNQIEEQSSLLLRYQQEIEALRAQLDDQVRANRDAFVSVAVHDPLHPEVSPTGGLAAQ